MAVLGTDAVMIERAGVLHKTTAGEIGALGGGGSGIIAGVSGTITATPGSTLLIWASGAYTGGRTLQALTLNYNSSAISTVSMNVNGDVGFSLIGRVTAVSSAAVSVTVATGSLSSVSIMWLEIS